MTGVRRLFVVGVAASLLATACGDDAGVLLGGTLGTSGPTTTATGVPSPGSTAVADSSIPSDSTAPSDTAPSEPEPVSGGDPTVYQILLRYDGVSGAGTFEATVCNRGAAAVEEIELAISANGAEARIAAGDRMEAQTCISYHDASMICPPSESDNRCRYR